MASGSLRCRLAGVDAAVARIHLHLRRQTVGGGLQVDAREWQESLSENEG